MARLKDKVAVVTGGARGMGGAAAQALAEDGAIVIITDLLADAGRAHADALVQAGGRAQFIEHDVVDAASWDAVVATVMRDHGRIDCLVNNAGISQPLTIEEATVDQFRTILDINLIGPFIGIKAILPALRQSGGGTIINVSSNSTAMIMPENTIYSASKAALANLTKTTAIFCALNGDNIRVNSIHPGPHETEMLTKPEVRAMPQIQALLEAIPMGRMGRPQEFGKLVAFLASDDSSYITATELFCDGGLTAISYASPSAKRDRAH